MPHKALFYVCSTSFNQISDLRLPMEVTKILIVRFSSIGDIVLTTPIIRALKTQLEGDVEIDFITKKVHASILDGNPYLSEIITIDKHVSEVSEALKRKRYDYVVDLHSNLRSRQVKRACKALSFTLDKRNIAKWIYVNTKREWLPIGHVVERSFHALKGLGIEDDGKGLDYFIPAKSKVDLSTLPESVRSGYICYAIGGKMKGKILPTEKIIAICKAIEKPVVLLGGPEDRAVGDAVFNACGKRVFNACGAFSLQQSASILQQSEKVITHDTGLMHIASALKKPVISIWLATTPQIGFSPWQPGSGSVMIEADCKKRPTSKLGNRGFEDGCVFNVDVEAVVKAVNE